MGRTENFEISSLEDLFENAKMTVATTDLDKYENALYHEIFIKEEYAIAKSTIQKAKTILDIATGTGDFAILSAKELRPQRMIGIDISEGMMKIGQKKVEAEGLQHIVSFKKDDCTHLSFDDNSFDAVTAAFGIRNFQADDNLAAAIVKEIIPYNSIHFRYL